MRYSVSMLYNTSATMSPSNIIIYNKNGNPELAVDLFKTVIVIGNTIGFAQYIVQKTNFMATRWGYASEVNLTLPPNVTMFNLEDIDKMRDYLLRTQTTDAVVIDKTITLSPYKETLQSTRANNGNLIRTAIVQTQEGLALKTYQSDLFNNWLKTESIVGPGSISEITAVSTAAGSFTIDALNLAQKVYRMLNSILVAGGSYQDWIDAVYRHERATEIKTPMYIGGLIKEITFDEVVSVAASENTDVSQPLGTIGGVGRMGSKHKGGTITAKADEPSIVIGITSITPRLDYSQGNKWDVNIRTMDDFHKPALDQIGFQDLITDQMAYWETQNSANGTVQNLIS